MKALKKFTTKVFISIILWIIGSLFFKTGMTTSMIIGIGFWIASVVHWLLWTNDFKQNVE